VHLGVTYRYPHGVPRGLGLYLKCATFFDGEEDVGEQGLGGDGQVAQRAAAQPGYGTRPGYKLASFAGAGKLRRELSLVRGRAHYPKGYTVRDL
jgi:hypothetical protein